MFVVKSLDSFMMVSTGQLPMSRDARGLGGPATLYLFYGFHETISIYSCFLDPQNGAKRADSGTSDAFCWSTFDWKDCYRLG